MPRQLLLSRVPVDLSILEFDLTAGEDIFLTYTWERCEGPPIRRTGKGPPDMLRVGGYPDESTTHPFGLRLGTWLLQEEDREPELEQARLELERARANRAPKSDLRVLRDTIDELASIRTHCGVFSERYPEYNVLAQQGCGDLTMNEWNVAFIDNPLADAPPRLVCLSEEKLDPRRYSCLVKWKNPGKAARVTIEEVRFKRAGVVAQLNEMVWVRFREDWLPRANRIEFAVSNQQVIRNGAIVPIVTTCHQFGDLRHLLQMPNLNPDVPLYDGEPGLPRPRQYFNELQYDDIWLGEEMFLREGQNLLRAALAGPILLDIPPNADELRLRGALTRTGYREVTSAIEPLHPGGWRLVRTGRQTVLEIYFRRNTYGWTMIGLSSDNHRLFCLASTGTPGVTGYALEEAAEHLLRAGAWNALLIDEGADVLQRLRGSDGRLVNVVPSRRRRLRATFILAHRREDGAADPPKGETQPEESGE